MSKILVPLSKEQIKKLHMYEEEGLKKLGNISKRDLLLVGLGLH